MLGIALLSLIYLRFRSISSEPTELLAPLARRYSPPQGAPSNSSQSHHRLRDHRHGLTTSLGASRGKGEVEGNPMGGSGFIWATDERNYRWVVKAKGRDSYAEWEYRHQQGLH